MHGTYGTCPLDAPCTCGVLLALPAVSAVVFRRRAWRSTRPSPWCAVCVPRIRRSATPRVSHRSHGRRLAARRRRRRLPGSARYSVHCVTMWICVTPFLWRVVTVCHPALTRMVSRGWWWWLPPRCRYGSCHGCDAAARRRVTVSHGGVSRFSLCHAVSRCVSRGVTA